MGFPSHRWLLGCFGRRAVDPLSARDASRLRSDARALIRIANETERARLRPARESGDDGQGLRRTLAAAEHRLVESISEAMSRGIEITVIERDVIRPILHSMVIVSGTAHASVLRAIRSVSPAGRP